MDKSLQGAYWLAASIKHLDHNTGYASQVPVSDYFETGPSYNIPPSKKRKVAAPRQPEGGEEELLEESCTPLGGHSYPYDCYNVNIQDEHYNTKGTGSLHPPQDQCHCGFICKTPFDKTNHVTVTHAGGVWQSVTSVVTISRTRGLLGNTIIQFMIMCLCITAHL